MTYYYCYSISYSMPFTGKFSQFCSNSNTDHHTGTPHITGLGSRRRTGSTALANWKECVM